MREHDWTKVLGWPGYGVYNREIDEGGKKLKLWVRRKKVGLKLVCSYCVQHVAASRIHEVCEREVRDLPYFEYTTAVVVETYRVRCPRCGDTDRESGSGAEQGALQQALRGSRWAVMRECGGASGGAADGAGGEHGKVTMRKSYGLRTFRCLELALYHSLGKLPEPESTHEFF